MEQVNISESSLENIDKQSKIKKVNETYLKAKESLVVKKNENVDCANYVAKKFSKKKEKEDDGDNEEEKERKEKIQKNIKMLKRKAKTSQCFVNAFSNLTCLQNFCSSSGIDTNFDVLDSVSAPSSLFSPISSLTSFNKKSKRKKYDDWEVEAILDFKNSEPMGQTYLVKWKGWTSDYNSWEPIHHLTGCSEFLKQFAIISRSNKKEFRRTSICLRYILNHLTNISYKDPAPVLKLLNFPLNQFRGTEYHLDQLKKTLRNNCSKLIDFFIIQNKLTYYETAIKVYKNLQIEKKFGSVDNLIQFVEKRQQVLSKLQKWENELNEIESKDPNGCPLVVENFVDLDGPPPDFVYITRYKIECDLFFEEEPPLWCECGSINCYDNRTKCCTSIHEAAFAYNKYGTLILPPRRPIYECNKKCKCSIDCQNRVVQKGRKFKLAIFKTENERGWGVRTLERILKGKFVMEYVGEIITREEAERRDKLYNSEGKTYLFDLDFSEDKHFQYVVDSSRFGNCAHFINHSCNPNLEVYSAWIEHYNISVPRISFFSRRDIRKGEELTFDYKMSGPQRCNELIKTGSSNYLEEKEEKEKKENDFGTGQERFEKLNKFKYMSKIDLMQLNNCIDGQKKDNSIVLDQELLEKEKRKIDYEDEKVTNEMNAVIYDDVNTLNGNKNVEDEDLMIKNKIADSSRILCRCGSANCRYYLF